MIYHYMTFVAQIHTKNLYQENLGLFLLFDPIVVFDNEMDVGRRSRPL
jgi:hypothetical protein